MGKVKMVECPEWGNFCRQMVLRPANTVWRKVITDLKGRIVFVEVYRWDDNYGADTDFQIGLFSKHMPVRVYRVRALPSVGMSIHTYKTAVLLEEYLQPVR